MLLKEVESLGTAQLGFFCYRLYMPEFTHVDGLLSIISFSAMLAAVVFIRHVVGDCFMCLYRPNCGNALLPAGT